MTTTRRSMTTTRRSMTTTPARRQRGPIPVSAPTAPTTTGMDSSTAVTPVAGPPQSAPMGTTTTRTQATTTRTQATTMTHCSKATNPGSAPTVPTTTRMDCSTATTPTASGLQTARAATMTMQAMTTMTTMTTMTAPLQRVRRSSSMSRGPGTQVPLRWSSSSTSRTPTAI